MIVGAPTSADAALTQNGTMVITKENRPNC